VNRWNDSSAAPPSWASFFGVEGWARFVVVIADDLERRGLAHSIDADDGCVRLADGMVLGLTNLAQMCCQASPDRWPGIVAHHVGIALDPPDMPAADAMARDFARARTAMKLRLWARDSVPNISVVAWDIAEDLVAVLTYDLPEMLVTVKREDADKWSAPRDELWKIAVGNVRADGLLSAPALDVGNGAQVHVLEGDATFFAASHVLFLEAYAGTPPFGAVVAVPRRHVAVFHPITDLRVVDAVSSMLNVVPRMFHEGPGSITSSLYWWRPGHSLMRLPWEVTETAIDFLPPPAFADMLSRLPPPRRG
jgi:hypothetical protein